MKWFKNRKTKWIPLGNYTFAGTDYIVFSRVNTRTGIMDFKVKKVQKWKLFTTSVVLPSNLIDTKKQWEKLIEITNQS